MFIHTADQNYIGARSAFFERRDYDFWWLILHAVEKYLKAIILMNGQSANRPSHNLDTLLRRLKTVDTRLVPPAFERPRLAGKPGWFEEPRPFIDRLNTYGSPQNRYAAYSYVISDSDLFAADQLVYWARRHARVLKQTLVDGTVVDWPHELAENPRLWVLHDGSPLEILANSSLSSAAATPFVRGNVPFFPNRRHQPVKRRGTAIRNSPFFHMLNTVKNPDADPLEQAEMRATLEWAVRNIFLPKEDVDHINDLLAKHTPSARGHLPSS